MDYFVLSFLALISISVLLYSSRIVNATLGACKEKTAELPLMTEIPLLKAGAVWLVFQLMLIVILRQFYQSSLLAIVQCSLLLAVMLPCAWQDFYTQLIPNKLLIVGIFIRVALFALEVLFYSELITYYLASSLIAAIGLVATSALCRVIVPDSVGYGDVKLLGVMGLYLGVENAFNAMMFSMVLLFVVSVYLIAVKKADRKTELPFAPFLLIGTTLSFILMGA